MDSMTQVLLTVTIPTVTVLVGILVSNARLNDVNMRISELREHFDHRLDDLRDSLRAEMRRIEEVMDARLKHLEERIR